jgi:thiol-disulfide isomerase/thioredoxin
LAVALLSWGCSGKSQGPYDSSANPAAEFDTALARGASEGKQILLIFGANWCPDCRDFAKELSTEPLQGLVADHFVVLHVNIGNWNKNMDFVARFGEPVAQGIPSIAITDPKGIARYVTVGGELASVRSLTNQRLYEWFQDVITMISQGFPKNSGG